MIYNLDEPLSQDPERVGQKAANLARLARSGFPVPASLFVGTEYYLEFLANPEISKHLATPLRKADEEIEALFLQMDLPGELASFLESMSRLIPADAFAVRSSATVEDLGHASFAGLFSSFVGVRFTELGEKIRRVWASAHLMGVRTYCARMGLTGQEVKMAVILQEYIPGFAQGVLFTHRPEEILIDVQSHKQQKLRRPTHYRIARSDLAVHTHIYGSATQNILGDRDRSCLCQAANSIEQLFGVPQDIEWVLCEDGRLFILQARPTTAAA